MMHIEIAQLLGAEVDVLDYTEEAGGNVFVDAAPSSPDRCVVVYTTAGPEASSRMPYDPATFQVMVRGEADGKWALATWAKVYSVLHALRYTTLPGGTYLAWCIAEQSSPFRLGPDEQGRQQYSSNFRTEIINPTRERQ